MTRHNVFFNHILRRVFAAFPGRLAFMHIAFAASEGVPFSKTGGLADVVGALPRALAAHGHQISVYLPRYRQTKLTDPQTVLSSVTVPFDDRYRFCSVLMAAPTLACVTIFVDYPPYFDREALYGTAVGDYPDNAERFALFSRAVLEASKIWAYRMFSIATTGRRRWCRFCCVLCMRKTRPSAKVATVFTIHNMGYQGLFPPEILPLLMLPWDLFTIVEDGIFRTGEFPEGRAGVLRFRHHSEPQVQPGNSDHRVRIRAGRRIARPGGHGDRHSQRRRLRRMEPGDRQIHRRPVLPRRSLAARPRANRTCWPAFGSANADPKLPVIGIVSRFAAQKGFDLIAQIMDRLAREEMILVVLGSGDKLMKRCFCVCDKQFPQKDGGEGRL